MIKRIFFVSIAVLLAGCGSTDAPSFSSAVTSISTKLTSVADIIGSAREARDLAPTRGALGDVWTTSGGVNALSNSGNETLQSWIGHMFDPSFENSNNAKVTFVGRIANASMVLCVIANGGMPTDSTGLPTDGAHTLEFSSALNTTCGGSGGDVVGQTMTVTFTTLTDTTIFTKSVSAVLPAPEDACPFKMLVKNDGSDINIATSEDQNCSGRNQASAAVFRYNVAAKTTRFTYISQNFDSGSQGFEFYRGFLDENADEANILGIYGGQQNGTLSTYVAFTAAGKPTAKTTTALSVKSSGYTITDGVYNGCVNSATNAITTDDSLACAVTGTSIADAFPVITAVKAHNTSRTDIYGIGATTDVGFTTAANLYTSTP